MRIVGDCIIENGEVTVGVTLMVGITRTGAGLLDEAAAAAALRFLRPEAEAAAAAEAALVFEPATPPTTGPETTRFMLKLLGPTGVAIALAPVFV